MIHETESLESLFARIDRALAQKGRAIVAIDGHCGAGKSTLGRRIQQAYSANLFHMDDFFLPPDRKTPQRLAEPGGNVDRERFRRDVLDPILTNQPFSYRPYDCQTGELAAPVMVTPNRLEVVEGAYSLHPLLQDAYDIRVFCEISPGEQSARILSRNGPAMHRRFLNEWIPLENRYFEAYGIKELCDLVVRVTD